MTRVFPPPMFANLFSPLFLAGGGLAGFIIVLFGLPALLMWLWNITIPEVFGLRQIRYWQAFRLVIIVAILFGLAHLI